MKLDFRSVSIGAATAACALLLLAPAAAMAMSGADSPRIPASASAPTNIDPSLAAMVSSWAQSFADGRPNSDTVFPASLTPYAGGTARVTDLDPAHLACNRFMLNIRWPSEKAAVGAITAAVAEQSSVAMVRGEDGVIRGHYFVGSSTCSNSVFAPLTSRPRPAE